LQNLKDLEELWHTVRRSRGSKHSSKRSIPRTGFEFSYVESQGSNKKTIPFDASLMSLTAQHDSLRIINRRKNLDIQDEFSSMDQALKAPSQRHKVIFPNDVKGSSLNKSLDDNILPSHKQLDHY
jgi:DNA repair ATPase RecN